ncbi:M3K13 kinase, partial [Ramphastos sulfuratus]|nr:M3K13 kinase [Ramphastos sulfuratus]
SRPDLLKTEGIPSTEAASNGSPASGSPKMSGPSGKSRYRSKPRHRRGNSKGSSSDFPAVLKSQPAQDEAAPAGLPQPGPPPQPGQDIASCANNLRYFGPAAALRSPLGNQAQRRMAGSSPDLISAAVRADGRRGPQSPPGAPDRWQCCQTDPYGSCLQCGEEESGRGQPPAGTEPSRARSPPPAALYESAERAERAEERDFGSCNSGTGTPQHLASSVLPCKARPLQKSGDDSSEEEEGEVDSEVEFPRRQR